MDYQGNSNKAKAESQETPKKVVEKVVTGEVLTQKKSVGQRFKNIFFGGEFKSALRYIAADVLLPAARNLVVDATTKGIERMVYGESHSRRRQVEYRSRVQYNNPINRIARDPREPARLPGQPSHPYRASRHDSHDIILVSREEAELVLERLIDIVDKYEVASLADLYELVGLPSSHVDHKWGWSYLNNAAVRQVRNGYLLELPALEPI